MNKDDIYTLGSIWALGCSLFTAIKGEPQYAILFFLGFFWFSLKAGSEG